MPNIRRHCFVIIEMQEVLLMLPDKNELNNEITEQIGGGGSYARLRDPLQGANPIQEASSMQEVKIYATALPSAGTTKGSYIPLNSGKQSSVIEQRTALASGDLKTTVPNISDQGGLIKLD